MIEAQHSGNGSGVVRVTLQAGDRLGQRAGPDTLFVPRDSGNRDWREIEALIASGSLAIAPAPMPAPVPPDEVSDRQFFQALALEGIISQADALAAVRTGEIPPAMRSILEALPDDQQFAAEMLISGATTFSRSHALADTIRQALDWTPERLAAFWAAASEL